MPAIKLYKSVNSVNSGVAYRLTLGGYDQIVLAASGTVSSSGWSSPRLSPHYDTTPPADGFWEFDFIADPPPALALPVDMPVAAEGIFPAPIWVRGIRIIASNNSLDVSITTGVQPVEPFPFKAPASNQMPDTVIYTQELASYDDSFQPAGSCNWHSVRMKKLHHVLTLVVSGPDRNQIIGCVQRATAVGLIAAIVAAYATGGAALSAAIAAFLGALEDCLGASYTANVDDSSYWEYWCT